MPATPVPKLTTTLVLPWEANSTIFSASLLTCDFLMNSSLPTKPFRSHKPNILQWLLPMMLLNLLLCVVQILRLCLLTMACAKGCSENFSSGSTG
jgi:phosphatidylserine synthase